MKRPEVVATLREWAGDLSELEARFVRDPKTRLYYRLNPHKANELRQIHHTLRTAADMLETKP